MYWLALITFTSNYKTIFFEYQTVNLPSIFKFTFVFFLDNSLEIWILKSNFKKLNWRINNENSNKKKFEYWLLMGFKIKCQVHLCKNFPALTIVRTGGTKCSEMGGRREAGLSIIIIAYTSVASDPQSLGTPSCTLSPPLFPFIFLTKPIHPFNVHGPVLGLTKSGRLTM